ncbi:Uncharacterised protein [Mycobacteroides abscessus subsp. abscessus]|nr:Uncharacterised protein [Mycobacteroides abscessus subsp. abscessus]
MPSSTIIAELSEFDSLKSLPIRKMAFTAGASCGMSDTDRSSPTVSSAGMALVQSQLTEASVV